MWRNAVPKRLDLARLQLALHFGLCAARFLIFRFVQKFRSLFRAVGLGIGLGITTLFEGPGERKVLVNRSRRIALSRAAVHLLPAAVSLYIVAINLRGYFIGNELQGVIYQDNQKLAPLQIASKIQVRLGKRNTAHESILIQVLGITRSIEHGSHYFSFS
jgi:hypothetical protein